ncbi:GNAT family N-acetyltransferase [Calidifontibacter sp. DB0510]|uniref:GNAT family N-acetyltransferase n=1 Tax=Metallococcus carri TaxID=1656884 RepID=A0A967B2R4_9MICO|nr:GNAT family N-acetyltransferase [Metallococcus carri]NHN56315.1 GNAT family N-acetyltransferase [Metallococcus carri]NOP38633.1 GNAT family N-acetyltransferase [Calidifontibacter sp. DB2511S]
MEFEISPLRPSDAEVIGPAHNRIWREAYAGLLPPAVLASRDDAAATRRWRERGEQVQEHGRSAEGAVNLVARFDGQPVGWISVGPGRDDDPPTPTELWALYVLPEHWGAGVAGRLVTAGLPPGPAHLWVLDGNERAIAFYRKVGFDIDGATKELGTTGAIERRMTRR